jgi:hypothetical protein
VGRRVFNRLVVEISLAVGHCVSRYALWVYVRELGIDPEQMSVQDAQGFCGAPLRRFLAAQGLRLEPGDLRRLERQLCHINPYRADPYDRLARLDRVA